MGELLSQENPLVGFYLMLLFINLVIFTYSEQTGGFIFKFIKKGFMYKIFAYISLLFLIPLITSIIIRYTNNK